MELLLRLLIRGDPDHHVARLHDFFDAMHGVSSFEIVAPFASDLVGLQRQFFGHAVVASGEVDRPRVADLLRQSRINGHRQRSANLFGQPGQSRRERLLPGHAFDECPAEQSLLDNTLRRGDGSLFATRQNMASVGERFERRIGCRREAVPFRVPRCFETREQSNHFGRAARIRHAEHRPISQRVILRLSPSLGVQSRLPPLLPRMPNGTLRGEQAARSLTAEEQFPRGGNLISGRLHHTRIKRLNRIRRSEHVADEVELGVGSDVSLQEFVPSD